MNRKLPHVLIIGGGIGGPALSLFLQKVGITSSIYEAYPFKEAAGGGFNIAQNGMAILQELGIADLAIKKGTPAHIFQMNKSDGNPIGKFTFESLQVNKLPPVSMSRATLYELFLSELKEKNIPLTFEKRLTNITTTEEKVIAHFSDGTQEEGDLLVGADGVNSTVRKHILPKGPDPEFTGIIGVGAFVPLDKLPPLEKNQIEGLSFIFGQGGFFGYGGGDNGNILWWSNLTRDKEFTREEIVNPDWKVIKEELVEKFKDYYEPIPSLVKNSDVLFRHNIKDIRSLPTWHKDRVILIGDAAHAVSPNSGQGASMALEDAMMLAKILRDNEDYKVAFKLFEKKRKDRVERIIAEGRRRGNDKEILSPFKAKIRDWMMWFFFKFIGVKAQKWILEYKIDWEKKE